MPIFPLLQPLDDSALVKTTCHLYRTSLLRVLPLSALFVVILHYFRYGKAYLPLTLQPYHLQSAMVLMVLSLPVVGAMILVMDKFAKNEPHTTASIMIETFNRFISLMGALISIALLPLILIGVCYGIYFGLIYLHANFNILFAWIMLTPLLIFATIVTKIYAPWLIFSDGQDANEAQDTSSILVKNRYLKCFIHSIFAVLVILFLIKLPGLLAYYLPVIKTFPPLALQLGADVLLMIIGPWSLSFLLTDKYDLQIRKKAILSQANNQGTPKVKVPSAIPKKSDNVSF